MARLTLQVYHRTRTTFGLAREEMLRERKTENCILQSVRTSRACFEEHILVELKSLKHETWRVPLE